MPKSQDPLDLMFHALGDRSRRAMVERLARGPASVSELARPFEMSLPTVVQHLGVLEEAEAIGTVTSSRNSEVIHAGIYYRAGSWMARMCVSGKHALYRYCGERGIPHKNCGKLIVATNAKETEKLQSIKAHAEANGVLDMQLLSGEAARALEPALACDAALLSPSTGIIDSHAYMLSLRGEAEAAGAAFAFHTPLIRAKADAGVIEIEAGTRPVCVADLIALHYR